VAAKEAKLGTSYSVIEFPEKKGLLESLGEALSGEKPPLARQGLAGRVMQKVVQDWRWLSGFNDPQGVYARLPCDLELN
jgi:protease IV